MIQVVDCATLNRSRLPMAECPTDLKVHRIDPIPGRYELLEQLGAGGMGVVFKARDARLERLVALKVLHPQKGGDPERMQRFAWEAKAASALSHPNIVTIYEIE